MGRTGMPPIAFQRPSLPGLDAIESYYSASETARWYSNGGPCTTLLAERIGGMLACDVVPVANGTLGLMVALAGLRETGALRGPVILVPSFTFTATAAACSWVGLEPVFVDIEPEGWHMDPDALRDALEALGPDVGAVMPVAAFGTPPSPKVLSEWEGICAEAGIRLIVDAAAGFGALARDGRIMSVMGDITVFSMHATKPFAAGEGGLVCCRDERLGEAIASLVNFGFDAERVVRSSVGLNAKLAELPAATALAALDTLPAALEGRRSSAALYRGALEPHLAFQAECDRSTWQFVPALARSRAERDAALRAAADAGIECRSYYDPLHRFPAYQRVRVVGALPCTEDVSARILSLPLAPDMPRDQVEYVCEVLGAVIAAP